MCCGCMGGGAAFVTPSHPPPIHAKDGPQIAPVPTSCAVFSPLGVLTFTVASSTERPDRITLAAASAVSAAQDTPSRDACDLQPVRPPGCAQSAGYTAR